MLKDPLLKMGYNVEFTRGQKRLISLNFEPGRVPKTPSTPSTPSSQSEIADDVDDQDDYPETFPAGALGALRKINGPFSDDCAVEQIMRNGFGRVEAEAWVKRLVDEGRLTTDPEGYLRLIE